MHHNFTYGISALVSQTSFRGETSGGVMKVLADFLRLCLLWALHLSPFYQNNVKNVEIIDVVTIWPGLWCPIGFRIINHSCFIVIPQKGEKEGFSAEEVNIASVLGIDDPQGPIHWLKTSWYDLIHRVMVELAIPENSQEIGNVSPEEVREALIECTGEVSRAKAKCVEIRKKKVWYCCHKPFKISP